MKWSAFVSKNRGWCLAALVSMAGIIKVPDTNAQNSFEQAAIQPSPLDQRAQVKYDYYILGPGDSLQIELLDLPELSGRFSIGPDGTLYLPRLRALYVEGLTIEELSGFLTQQFKTYVREPQVYVRPVQYRPIRVYVGGEVKRPGYYTLTGIQSLNEEIKNNNLNQSISSAAESQLVVNQNTIAVEGSDTALFPTVFDAIRSAQGITPYTDLTRVEVIRKRANSLGGGKIKTSLNFLSLIYKGDDSQNIRLFDGDTINIGKSSIILRDQLIKAGQSNLSPRFMEVFVTGRVNMPGGIKLPPGSSLNQAISIAGGAKLLKGKIDFVRFNREGTIDRRIFAYNPGASADSPDNPVLAAGDLIRVNESILSSSANIINEITNPFVGLYSVYRLFNDITQ